MVFSIFQTLYSVVSPFGDFQQDFVTIFSKIWEDFQQDLVRFSARFGKNRGNPAKSRLIMRENFGENQEPKHIDTEFTSIHATVTSVNT